MPRSRANCRWSWYCWLIAGTVLAGGTSAQLNYRLSTDVVPDAYNITIKPYLLAEDGVKQFTFDGAVAIAVRAVTDNVRSITLHKDYIEIESVWLHDADGGLVEAIDVDALAYETSTDKLTVPLQNALLSNASYTLHFKYSGLIRDGLAGFFRANYTDASGNAKWIGVTQLQRIDARCAFPCFDEPAFKAKFQMHISRPAQYNSVFNTQCTSTEPDGDDRMMDHFNETPLMSTYLVAFIVSDFAKYGDTNYSIIIRPDYLDNIEFSYNVGLKTIDAYNDYLQLPYKELGIPTMQKAGSPKFPHNGMENWGLVIYKDEVLVHEPNYTDGWSNREYTISILVHETAHMWFGNSVTFDWWSYFWLNEAFARYYQYFMSHQLYPEYRLDLQFVVNQMHLIFGTDAANSTQPMTTPADLVATPSQIASKFSSIAYAKGACFVRMMRNIMGHENFDNGIREYLKENHLKNTVPEDFFMHMRRHWPSGHQVALDEFFYDWTEQVGFPVISVSLSADSRTITIAQQRFLLNATDGSDASLRYTIPITYTTDWERDFEDLEPRFYLNRSDESYSWQEVQPINWVIFNIQQSNYHRVYYEPTLLRSIGAALAQVGHSGVHVSNRAHLIDDLFNFGRVGLVEYEEVFSILEYLQYETEYTPWYAAFSGLPRVVQRLTIEQLDDFRRYLFDIAERVFQELGVVGTPTDTTALDVYNRNKVVAWLCKYGHEECNERARSKFADVAAGGVKLTPDERETIYCAAVRFGGFEYYQKLADWYAEEQHAAEKEKLVRAMGCTANFFEHHYVRILSDAIPEEHKRTALTPIYAQNPENVTPAFRKINETLEALTAALGSWASTASVISDLANYFTTAEQKEMLEDFIAAQGEHFGASVTVLHNAVLSVETNLQWAENRLPNLIGYLGSRSGALTNRVSALLCLLLAFVHLLLSK